MLLYKYRAPVDFKNIDDCYTARLLNTAQLFFARPSSFNDPYEGHIELDFSAPKEKAEISHMRVLRERNRQSDIRTETLAQTWVQVKRNVDSQLKLIASKGFDFERYYDDMVDQRGVLALSEDKNNLLMWAHYGEEHKGLCLGFDWKRTELPKAQQVAYNSTYRTVDYWSYTEDELAGIACTQKSMEWAYEREWRSISLSEYEYYGALEIPPEKAEEYARLQAAGDDYWLKIFRERHTFRQRKVKVHGSRALDFPRAALVEVIFGARMTNDEIKCHKRLINNLGYKPLYLQAVRDRVRYALGLKTV